VSTFQEIEDAIVEVLRYDQFDAIDIQSRINDAVNRIAGGLQLNDGRFTPPLPDLLSSATVATETGQAYAALPSGASNAYHRGLFHVSDANKDLVKPPRGGDYYSFQTFVRRAQYGDLSETGSIYMCCVRGANLYYQGIPSSSVNLLVRFYRKPVAMSASDDTPDGLPVQFHLTLPKHLICAEVYGEHVGEDLQPSTGDKNQRKAKYHFDKLQEQLFNLTEFVGEEGEPYYFNTDMEDY
jgi:hypothetical protein